MGVDFPSHRPDSLKPCERNIYTYIPFVTIAVVILLSVCCILEFGLREPAFTAQTMSNAWLYCWFNKGGFFPHALPNMVLGALFGFIVEWNVGSVNMLLVALLSYL